MRQTRAKRPQKSPIFIGGEGQSELGYAGWLLGLVRDRNLPFHLELCNLGRGAGDPLVRIDLAFDRLTRMERNREPFVGRFLFLDTDQFAADPAREGQAHQRAQEHGFTVIWQVPTHEAFLLRHFPGRDTRQPPNKQAADTALAKEWPDYRKPSSAQQLEQRLGLDGALRVARRLPELDALLRMIGLSVN